MAKVLVTGLGLACSLHDVVTACAAARAGIVRARELPYFGVFDEDAVEFVPVTGHECRPLTGGFQGNARLLRLGVAALKDLFAYAGLKPGGFSRTALFLNLRSPFLSWAGQSSAKDPQSDERPERGSRHPLMDALCRLGGLPIAEELRFVLHGDHHGVATALNEASALLRRSAVERCIIGGIDSFLERETLELLNRLRLLKTAENPVGFMPGEAAAFFILERADVARQRGARIEAELVATSLVTEQAHRFSGPTPGSGLATAMRRAL
jgi:hypothetical protein